MFKGNSKLELSELTLVTALQEYFDKRAKEGYSPLVRSIKAAPGGGGYGSPNTFIVEVEEPKGVVPNRSGSSMTNTFNIEFEGPKEEDPKL